MKFHKLPPKRQQQLVDERIRQGDCAPDYDWWEHSYDEFISFCESLGLDISYNTREWKTRSGQGRAYKEYELYFDLGRGRGVTFNATYRPVKTVLPEIYDDDVKKSMEALRVYELTRRMLNLEEMHGHVKDNRVTADTSDDETDLEAIEGFENLLEELVDSLAYRLFQDLESEHDYFFTEEYIREELEALDEDYEEDEEDEETEDTISDLN